MAAPEHLQDMQSSSTEVPEVTVFQKPLIPPRPGYFRLSNPRVLPFISPALDLTELKKTQKRVRFLLERETCTSPVSFAKLARPTYHGKCFLCRNNIGDPHTHYNHPVFRSTGTDPNKTTSFDSTDQRRNSIVIPSEMKRLEVRKILQGFWESRNNETEEDRFFIPIFPNNKMSNRKHKFRNISLSQNLKSKPKHGDVMVKTSLHEDGDTESDLTAGTIRKRETDQEREHDASSDKDSSKDHKGSGPDVNRKPTQQQEKTYLVPELERRSSLGRWCECQSSEPGHSECWECGLETGHERWCRFKTGECPDCGKPIKGKHRVTFRPRHFRTASSSSPDSDETREKKRRSKRSEKYLSHSNCYQPSDPNVHRQAYILALADARIQRWRTDPLSFSSPSTGGYFSYFPSLNVSKAKSEVKDTPCLGVRVSDDKVKVKDPMKHILGSVKLSDYYPKGKKFRKEN